MCLLSVFGRRRRVSLLLYRTAKNNNAFASGYLLCRTHTHTSLLGRLWRVEQYIAIPPAHRVEGGCRQQRLKYADCRFQKAAWGFGAFTPAVCTANAWGRDTRVHHDRGRRVRCSCLFRVHRYARNPLASQRLPAGTHRGWSVVIAGSHAMRIEPRRNFNFGVGFWCWPACFRVRTYVDTPQDFSSSVLHTSRRHQFCPGTTLL